MVDDLFIAGDHLHGGDPFVGVEASGEDEAAVVVFLAGDVVALGHLDDQIGVAELPLTGSGRWIGQVGWVALGGTGGDPIEDGLAFDG